MNFLVDFSYVMNNITNFSNKISRLVFFHFFVIFLVLSICLFIGLGTFKLYDISKYNQLIYLIFIYIIPLLIYIYMLSSAITQRLNDVGISTKLAKLLSIISVTLIFLPLLNSQLYVVDIELFKRRYSEYFTCAGLIIFIPMLCLTLLPKDFLGKTIN